MHTVTSRNKPSYVVFRAPLHQDDQQLRERNVENAQDEERTECSRAPVKDEGRPELRRAAPAAWSEEEVEPVAGERGRSCPELRLDMRARTAHASARLSWCSEVSARESQAPRASAIFLCSIWIAR